MYRDHVRKRDGALKVAHELDMERVGFCVWNVRVVGYYLHAEGAGALRNLAAYPTEADDEKLFPAELAAGEFIPVPFPGVERRAGLRNLSHYGEHVGHRQFRRGERVSARRVDDDYPVTARGREVDVVDADAGAAYDL